MPKVKVCSLKNVTNDSIFLDSFVKPCHFHLSAREFGQKKIMPDGVCPEMYYLTYPYYFATAYGAKFNQKLFFSENCYIKCPKKDARIEFELQKTPAPFYEKFKNIIKKVLASSMVYQVAMQYCGVVLKIRNKSDPKNKFCPKQKMFEKNNFSINFGDEEGRGLCPAAFRTIFPYQALMHLRRLFQNKKNRIFPLVTCPDHLKQLHFKIKPNQNEKVDEHNSICEIDDDITVETQGNKKKVDEIMQDLGFPCPVMFKIIFPYYLTINNGGKLGFYTGKHRSAMVQCPNSKVKVHSEVGLSSKKDCFEIKITNIGGCSKCPKNIKKNDIYKINLNKDTKKKFNIHDLNYILFYSSIVRDNKESISLKAPFSENEYNIKNS